MIKFGTKGIVNLGKFLLGVSATIEGGKLDLIEIKMITNCAYKLFSKGDFSVQGENEDNVIEIEDK